MIHDSVLFIFKNIKYKSNFYTYCVQYITIILAFLYVTGGSINGISRVHADILIPAVPFFPERYVYLQKPKNKLHNDINHYILHDFKADGLKFLVGNPDNKADYKLILDYAVGCPHLGESNECRLLVLWDLLRGDNAPVTSWQAYYPLNIPIKKQLNRFKNYHIPKKMIGNDFIKSLNYETLKKQDFDKVYVKPDRLSDETTLCSLDTIHQFYEGAGLYITDTAHKARFLITTTVTPLKNQDNQTIIGIKRMILDRLTGQYQIFPIETAVEKDFLANDSYDCRQSAGITIQDIGLFIDKAP
jgi:hypothetical protein